MQKLQARRSSGRMQKVAFSLVILVFCYMAWLIITKLTPYWTHSDIVNEINYLQSTWEQKTLFPEGFRHSAELLSARLVLPYWLFYALTGNFMLSASLSQVTLLAIQLCLVWVLLKKLNVQSLLRSTTLIMYMVWMTYSTYIPPMGVVLNAGGILFWPMSAYAGFGISVLLCCILTVSLWKNLHEVTDFKQKNIIVTLIIYALVAIYMGYGTLRLTMVMYLPFCCVGAWRIFYNYINKRTISKQSLLIFLVYLMGAILNVVSYVLSLVQHKADFLQTSLAIAPMDQWFSIEVISAQLNTLLLAFGVAGEGDLFSLSGMTFVVTLCFAVFIIIALLHLLKRYIRVEDQAEADITWYWLFVTVIILAYQIFTGSLIPTPRYYFITTMMVPILCGLSLQNWSARPNGEMSKVPAIGITLALMILFGIHVKADANAYQAPPPELSTVAEYIEENGYKYVTASYWNAGVIKGLTNGAVDALHCASGVLSLDPFEWIIDTRKFDEERHGTPNIILMTDDEEQVVIAENGNVLEVLETYTTKVKEIGQYNLYAATENPFLLMKQVTAKNASGLPADGEHTAVDCPATDGYHINEQLGFLNDSGQLQTNGGEGYVLYGPYAAVKEGIFDVVLHYTVEACEADFAGTFDVAVKRGSELVAMENISKDDTTLTLTNVMFSDMTDIFEARVCTTAGTKMTIQSIEYIRK